MKSYQELFAEFKRRSVFKVSAVYGAVAFGLIQFADPLAKALLLPDAFLTYVAAILILGFPLALVLAWAFELTPEGVRRTQAASPEEIRAIVAEPASRRWPSGILGLLGLAALIAGAAWVGRRTVNPAPDAATAAADLASDVRLAYVEPDEDPRPSIAVLPFTDLSPEGDQEYFSDGITEEISNTLAGIRELRVAARTSAFAYKDVQRDLRDIGTELAVGYLLEGSVRKAGDRLRITAQLIDARSNSHLWSDSYDRTLDDVFAIQAEIARAIADALRISLGLEEGDALVQPTADLEAYDLYLAARARMRERGERVFEATRLFEAAIARDSAWAPAWAGLAESLALHPYYGPGPVEPQVPLDSAYWASRLEAAEGAARRALALDPESSSATVALGNILRDRWDWDAAERAYLQALTVDPDNVEGHQQYAEFLAYVGRTHEAELAARRALALDRSPVRLNVAAYTALENGHPDEAIEFILSGIELDTEDRVPWLKGNLLMAYVAARRWEQARDVAIEHSGQVDGELQDRIRRSWPAGDTVPGGFDADLLARPIFHTAAAELWMALGNEEAALEFLEREWRDAPPFGESVLLFAPAFDPLRDSSRFQALLRSRGLEGRRPIRTPQGVPGTP